VIRLAALAAVVLLAGSACGASGASGPAGDGGSGVVTAGRIGPLRIDASTPAAIEAFAGKPDMTATGTRWPGAPSYRAFGYGCSRANTAGALEGYLPGHVSCRTIYYVNSRTSRLAAFYTKSPEFRTTSGIHTGMAQDLADRRERQTPHGPFNAIGESSSRANLVLPSSCPLVMSGRCPGKVLEVMLESNQNPI
jgi:hypothetical protein